MPELPEVEALRRGLVKSVLGSTIQDIEVRQEKLIAGKGTTRRASKEKTREFVNNLTGKTITSIERRAKNLIFKLNTSEIILVHLKMTGQLVFKPNKVSNQELKRNSSKNSRRGGVPGYSQGNFEENFSDVGAILGGHPIEESESALPHKHTYIIFKLSNGTLYYNDVRLFGYVLYFTDQNILEQEKHFDKIGLEPFDKSFTIKYFKESLKKFATPIKKLLLDQKVVVGCGNIYCDEVLWASSVLPTRSCKTLSDVEVESIYKNIKKILEKAINSGGSSIANYLLADGKRGNYADYHKVYKKENTKCKFPGCTGTIKKITFAGRGTHFCPVHQH